MELLYYALSVNGLLFVFSVIFYFFQPKNINFIYGYRTNRTIVNDEIWKYANKVFSKNFLIYSSISFVFAIVLSFVFTATWQFMALMILALGVAVIQTEQTLNKKYDKEGNKL